MSGLVGRLLVLISLPCSWQCSGKAPVPPEMPSSEQAEAPLDEEEPLDLPFDAGDGPLECATSIANDIGDKGLMIDVIYRFIEAGRPEKAHALVMIVDPGSLALLGTVANGYVEIGWYEAAQAIREKAGISKLDTPADDVEVLPWMDQKPPSPCIFGSKSIDIDPGILEIIGSLDHGWQGVQEWPALSGDENVSDLLEYHRKVDEAIREVQCDAIALETTGTVTLHVTHPYSWIFAAWNDQGDVIQDILAQLDAARRAHHDGKTEIALTHIEAARKDVSQLAEPSDRALLIARVVETMLDLVPYEDTSNHLSVAMNEAPYIEDDLERARTLTILARPFAMAGHLPNGLVVMASYIEGERLEVSTVLAIAALYAKHGSRDEASALLTTAIGLIGTIDDPRERVLSLISVHDLCYMTSMELQNADRRSLEELATSVVPFFQ